MSDVTATVVASVTHPAVSQYCLCRVCEGWWSLLSGRALVAQVRNPGFDSCRLLAFHFCPLEPNTSLSMNYSPLDIRDRSRPMMYSFVSKLSPCKVQETQRLNFMRDRQASSCQLNIYHTVTYGHILSHTITHTHAEAFEGRSSPQMVNGILICSPEYKSSLYLISIGSTN